MMNDRQRKMQEAERLSEMVRGRCQQLLTEGLRLAQTADITGMERCIEHIKAQLKPQQVPRPLAQDVLQQVKKMEIIGYKYYIDDQLHKARHAAQTNNDRAKHQHVKNARDYLPKAFSCGCGEEFKNSVMKRIEIISFTGNAPPPPEGTTAKPVDKNAPQVPNRAKFF